MKETVSYTASSREGILLNANENPYPMSREIRKEITDAMADIEFNRYPEDDCKELIEAYSAYIGLPASQILAGNGSDQMLGQLIGTFLSKDKVCVTVTPDFSMYDYYCSAYQATLLKYPLNEDGSLDLNGFISFIKAHDASLVLFSNPNNPTGSFVALKDIIKLCRSVSCPVVVDEAYVEFAEGSAVSLIDSIDNLYVTRTLSKAFGLAALRVGFLMSNEKNMKPFKTGHVPYSVNSFSMKAAQIVLKHADEYMKVVEELKARRDAFYTKTYTRLTMLKSSANFVLIKSEDIEALKAAFDAKGLTIRTYAGKDYVRISIGTREQNDLVCEVLDAFEKEGK